MPDHTRRTNSVIACLTIAALCLLSFPTSAQQAGPQRKQATVADDDFISLQQQIKELKSATFRAFLRMQLLKWESPDAARTRRQAAMQLATQGVTDLCEHEDEIWPPTASWLRESFVKHIKTLQSPEQPAVQICALKTGPKNSSESDLSSGIKMLNAPETSAAGLNLAKSAILNGRIQPSSMLGPLLQLNAAHSPHLYELLSAAVSLEEKQPGALTLRMMPFFTSLFLGQSVPPELTKRWVFVAVRATRLPAEELDKLLTGSQATTLLNGVAGPAKQLTPDLYPEIASRLKYLNKNAPNSLETRLAAEERIQKSADQLEQLISEADSASEQGLKTQFFSRAARAAKEQGKLTLAVDLIMKAAENADRDWANEFLLEIVSVAIKNRSPFEAGYAIPKMTRPIERATAFRLLGEYYGGTQETVKSKLYFTQSAREIESLNNANEKARALLSLAESVLKYEPADAFGLFRDAVKAINNMPAPDQDKEKMYYVQLLPIATDLIRSFNSLAISEKQTASNLAAEIKLSELRVSAMSGVYSGHECPKSLTADRPAQ